MEARRAASSSGTSERIATSVARLREELAGTAPGSGPDPTVRARLDEGLKVTCTDPRGNAIETDMPEAIGGEGSAMSPGSVLRSAVAACDATAIAIEAASRGIELSALDVEVASRSDHRGLLGLPGADPQPEGLEVNVRIAAPGVAEQALRSLVADALDRSPVAKAVERPVAVEVSLEVGPGGV